MSKTIQVDPLTNMPTNFCFKYCINLGDDKFGTMTINEKTNLYEQAQNFCKLYGLQPYIAVILENQIFQQTLRIKEQIMNRQIRNGKSVGKIQKNKSNLSQQKINLTQSKNSKNSLQKSKSKSNIRSSNISQQTMIIKASRIDIEKKSKSKQRNENISKHFENMFKKHEQIESKKQMSRKASYQKIPFKPVINNLSRKIVDLKRNSMSKNNNQLHKENFIQKVYFKNNMKPVQISYSKQKYNKQNVLNSDCRKISKITIKTNRSKSKIII